MTVATPPAPGLGPGAALGAGRRSPVAGGRVTAADRLAHRPRLVAGSPSLPGLHPVPLGSSVRTSAARGESASIWAADISG